MRVPGPVIEIAPWSRFSHPSVSEGLSEKWPLGCSMRKVPRGILFLPLQRRSLRMHYQCSSRSSAEDCRLRTIGKRAVLDRE
jgi:hypothetical protein